MRVFRDITLRCLDHNGPLPAVKRSQAHQLAMPLNSLLLPQWVGLKRTNEAALYSGEEHIFLRKARDCGQRRKKL